MNEKECLALDNGDSLAVYKDKFDLPEDIIYLDGNSLGALPHGVSAALGSVVNQQWGRGLIRSWNQASWIDLPQKTARSISRLIGCSPEEVVVADSTSVNLHKAMMAALALNSGRKRILIEADNFPTDAYITQGIAINSAYKIQRVASNTEAVLKALDKDVAVVSLTHVHYKTAYLFDMEKITQKAHEVGALVIWDLCHSAGALPVELSACHVDFAVGCTYKYLNAGPGAPAFIYVRKDLIKQCQQPLTGWMGHAKPFEFSADYEPAPGINRFLCGTPGVLGLAALDVSLAVFADVDMKLVREKSIGLTQTFIHLVDKVCGEFGLQLASPTKVEERGSHVSYRHPNGYAIVQALIEQNVIGDFRAPDILRFGFTPLYLSYVDVWNAVEVMREILAEQTWREPRFAVQNAVT